VQIRDSYLARRRFLCGMIGGGAAALGAEAGVGLTFFAGNLREEPPPARIELPAAEADLAPGSSKLVMYGRVPALLIRTPQPEAAMRALVAVCTHFACTVGYHAAENRILCACHGGVFDVEGRVLAGPPTLPLRPLYHCLRDGRLILALEKENLEPSP